MKTGGFSLLEAIIALAITAVVSVSACSIVISSVKHTERTRVGYLAVNECNNLINCCYSGNFNAALSIYIDGYAGESRLYYDISGGIYTEEPENWFFAIEIDKADGFSFSAYDRRGSELFKSGRLYPTAPAVIESGGVE